MTAERTCIKVAVNYVNAIIFRCVPNESRRSFVVNEKVGRILCVVFIIAAKVFVTSDVRNICLIRHMDNRIAQYCSVRHRRNFIDIVFPLEIYRVGIGRSESRKMSAGGRTHYRNLIGVYSELFRVCSDIAHCSSRVKERKRKMMVRRNTVFADKRRPFRDN